MEMRVPERCAKCLYDGQARRVSNPDYLKKVAEIIENRKPSDSAPYLVYLFNQVQEEMFGTPQNFADIKRASNDMMLGLEEEFRKRIESAPDPLATAFLYARVGNYIDFGVIKDVDEKEFFSLFDRAQMSPEDEKTFQSFVSQCETAKNFLLIADNCGEIVLDKLFVWQLQKHFPQMKIRLLVRGKEALNDVTPEDAIYVGMEKMTEIIDNGIGLAGTVIDMLPEPVKKCMEQADVILAKGQGNYETLNGCGMHIFYSFLCKCDLFVERFHVPLFTGMFIEEW